jgi:1-acyl-sn-glycerol-3-phosphate acyltransferase
LNNGPPLFTVTAPMTTDGDRTLAPYHGPTTARGAFGALTRLREELRRRADATVDALLGDEVLGRLQRLPVQRGHSGVDPFGFDPNVAKYAVLVARAIYKNYFRTEVHGLANVPKGRVLLISNHSGQLPLDGLAIASALLLEGDPPRFVRSMVEKWSATLPFVSELFARCGQIVGVPENCIRLLEMEEAVLVFPEGARGISKTFDQRYKLTEFGLGFMRLALQTNTPVVPVAVVGAEEQYISVANVRPLARLLGMPAAPVMPQLLLPGGFLPLPTKYRVYFGEPMTFHGDPDDEDAAIEEKVWLVKSTIQSMLNRGLKERQGIFF